MLQYLRDVWRGGGDARHIEELVSDVFVDFAPYAGADTQRLTFTRQHGRVAASSLTIEDSGEWLVGCTHVHAGSLLFSSAGLLQPQLAVRVPLVTSVDAALLQRRHRYAPRQQQQQQRCEDAVVDDDAVERVRAASRTRSPPAAAAVAASSSPAPAALPAAPHDDKSSSQSDSDSTSSSSSSSLLRFALCGRGGVLLRGLPHIAMGESVMGQLEVDAPLPALWSSGRRSAGVRCGPVALRWSSTPHAEEWPAAAAATDNNTTAMTAATATQTTGTRTRWHLQHTLDAAVCAPLATPHVPLAVTLGMQQPLPYGDTLVGVAVHSDRARHTSFEDGDKDDDAEEKGDDDDSSSSSRHGAYASTTLPSSSHRQRRVRYGDAHSDGDVHTTRPRYAVRLLAVQTLSSRTLTPPPLSSTASMTASSSLLLDGDDDGDGAALKRGGFLSAAALRRRIVAADKPWYTLPTLLGLHVSCLYELVRVSTAAIVHDGAADLEAAVMVDATPLLPQTPTLVRVGWSNSRRLALGVTSLVGRVLTVTLGVHYMPGERPRFGLEFRA